MKENNKRIIKILILIIVLIVVVFIVLGEIDRRKPIRSVIPPIEMYYKCAAYLTAPVNLYIDKHLINERDETPFPDMKRNFPRHVILQDNWMKIKDEVLSLYNDEGMKKIKGDMFFNEIADENWKKFYIKWHSDSSDEAREKLPFTTKLIDSLPEVRIAMISVLEPGAVITPHIGLFRGCLRYHLGLSTPNDDKCRIKVDGNKYSWRDGNDMLFDDTFVHEVKNETSCSRFILFCDIVRPLDSSSSEKVLNSACNVAAFTTRKN